MSRNLPIALGRFLLYDRYIKIYNNGGINYGIKEDKQRGYDKCC